MNIFHAKSVEEVLRELKTTPAGLSGAEARTRMARYGKNAFPKPKKPSLLAHVFGECKSTLLCI